MQQPVQEHADVTWVQRLAETPCDVCSRVCNNFYTIARGLSHRMAVHVCSSFPIATIYLVDVCICIHSVHSDVPGSTSTAQDV